MGREKCGEKPLMIWSVPNYLSNIVWACISVYWWLLTQGVRLMEKCTGLCSLLRFNQMLQNCKINPRVSQGKETRHYWMNKSVTWSQPSVLGWNSSLRARFRLLKTKLKAKTLTATSNGRELQWRLGRTSAFGDARGFRLQEVKRHKTYISQIMFVCPITAGPLKIENCIKLAVISYS